MTITGKVRMGKEKSGTLINSIGEVCNMTSPSSLGNLCNLFKYNALQCFLLVDLSCVPLRMFCYLEIAKSGVRL